MCKLFNQIQEIELYLNDFVKTSFDTDLRYGTYEPISFKLCMMIDAPQTFYLTQLQHTDTRLTSPSADPIMPGIWQGSHWSTNFEVTGMTRPGKRSMVKAIISNPRSAALEADT